MPDGLRDRLDAAFAEAIHLDCRPWAWPPGHDSTDHLPLARQYVAGVWPLIAADREQTRAAAYQQGRDDEREDRAAKTMAVYGSFADTAGLPDSPKPSNRQPPFASPEAERAARDLM